MKYLIKADGYVLMYSIDGGFDDWQYSEKIPPGFDPSTYTRFKQVNGELVFDPNREEELAKELVKSQLRELRSTTCFDVVNRGQVWYNTLTIEQNKDIEIWYEEWLRVTDTLIIPTKPSWL